MYKELCKFEKGCLNINRRKSYSTKVGGVISIFLLVIILFIFFFNLIRFCSKEKVFYTQETQFSPNPNQIVMDQTNYMAAFSIEQNDYSDNPMFDIIVEQRSQKRFSNGDLMKTSIKLELQPCTLDHFSILATSPSTQFQEEFNSLTQENGFVLRKIFNLIYLEHIQVKSLIIQEFQFKRVMIAMQVIKAGKLNVQVMNRGKAISLLIENLNYKSTK